MLLIPQLKTVYGDIETAMSTVASFSQTNVTISTIHVSNMLTASERGKKISLCLSYHYYGRIFQTASNVIQVN